jgi:membrane carboxypeptidase/penicillin-binding protein
LNLKFLRPDTTIFHAWNKIESFKKILELWLNKIVEGNSEMFQSYYIMEADDFYSQNSVSDIIAAHLKMMMMSFEKYYPEHKDPQRNPTRCVCVSNGV